MSSHGTVEAGIGRTRLRLTVGSLALVCLFAFLTIAKVLIGQIESAQDLVKLRNAVLLRVGDSEAYEWTPGNVPRDFLIETAPRMSLASFGDELRSRVSAAQTEFDIALRIAEHLGENRRTPAIPIKKDTLAAYRAIRESGGGYCADYTQVFNGLAYTAELTSREWGMSFDGYGGDGHAFNEVYDHGLEKWVFIDPFYSFYVVGDDGVPLSVEEFRVRLKKPATGSLGLRKIHPAAFSFKSEADALAYYGRGVDRLFMIWGNNVLTYDQHLAVRVAANFGRSVEQVIAILFGLQPTLVLTPDYVDRDALREAKINRCLLFAGAVAFLGFIMSGIKLLVWLRSDGIAHSATTTL